MWFIISQLLELANNLVTVWVAEGFKVPESVVSDGDFVYVSNINGKPVEKNNKGFISKLGINGGFVDKKFIKGSATNKLHAPKGLSTFGDTLYVADIDVLRAYELDFGEPKWELDFSGYGAKFLNDTVVREYDNRLLISDSGTNTIYFVDLESPKIFGVVRQDNRFRGANGLMIEPEVKSILVASFDGGQILEITPWHTLRRYLWHKDFRNLDGLAVDDFRNLYVSDFTAGRVYKIKPRTKEIELFIEGLEAPADISVCKVNNLLLIPEFKGNRVRALRLEGKG